MITADSESVGGRRMFWQMMVSLDGRTAGPNGELDWHVVDPAFNECVLEMLDSIDTILMGRHAWEDLTGYWPNAAGPSDSGFRARPAGLATWEQAAARRGGLARGRGGRSGSNRRTPPADPRSGTP